MKLFESDKNEKPSKHALWFIPIKSFSFFKLTIKTDMDVYATFYINLCISCKLLNKKSGIDDYFRAFLLDVRLIFIPEALRELRASRIVNKEFFTLCYYLRLLFKIKKVLTTTKGNKILVHDKFYPLHQTQPSEVYKFSFTSYSVHQGKIIRKVNLLGCVMGVW